MTLRKWLRAVLFAGLSLLAANLGFSRVLRGGAAHRYLIARLAASFGRPVEVSRFDFNLLEGRIEAHLVSVADDPHFGNEYFLRAEKLTAGLRWRALLRGRFEFGSVFLFRPSLNLASDAQGQWNIQRWLPPVAPPSVSRPAIAGAPQPLRDILAARLNRLDVDGGRINFKRQEEKIPFAFDDVSGRVEQDGAGRWRLDLEARPIRAGVALQQIGSVRVRGLVSGTTARLQPAELNLTWRDASLADALRLVRQNDYGLRGQLAIDLDARIVSPEPNANRTLNSGGAQWTVSGVTRLTGFHGWRLPERSTDPAVNLAAEVIWNAGNPSLDVRNLAVDMPASRFQGAGSLDWSHGFHPRFRIRSSNIGLADLLSWYRALVPDVPEELRAEGTLGLDLSLSGWPPQLEQGALTSAGASLAGKPLPAPVETGPLTASVSHGRIDVAPAEIFLAPSLLPAARKSSADIRGSLQSFTVRASILPDQSGEIRWPPYWNISVEGATTRAQDWLALPAALGRPVNAGWSASGGLSVKLRGVHRADSPFAAWLGTLEFLGMSWTSVYVNQPLLLLKGRVELAPEQRTVTLSSAQAFGAVWRGSLARKNSESQWSFDLSADRLSTAELDRWLGPRARPGFLARFIGLDSSPNLPPAVNPLVTRIAARGRLRVDEIDLPPLRLEKFEGEADIADRDMKIRKGQAEFFGGKVSGSFEAKLQPDPAYDFSGQFDRVNLAQLGAVVPVLNNRMDGAVSASLNLSAHGIGRDSLVSSLEGEGELTGRRIDLSGFELPPIPPSSVPDSAPAVFSSIQGAYRIHERKIEIAGMVLDHPRGRMVADGNVDFSHGMSVRIRPLTSQEATVPAPTSGSSFLLEGSIENPRLILSAVPLAQAARADARGR